MNTVAQTQSAAQQGFSAVACAQEILARDEGLSDELSALDAAIYRELLIAAGIPTDGGMELLSLLLAYGGGNSQLSVSDRELLDHVLPAGGKDIESKIRHVRFTRQKVREAVEAGGFPIIAIRPGHGTINAHGGKEGVPSAYRLPILEYRRDCLRQLPDDPDPGAIRAAAQSVIRTVYGGVRRKNDAGRKLRDVSARTSARTGIAHLRKIVQAGNAVQVVAEELNKEEPALRLVLSEALGQPPPPAGISPFEALEAAYQEFYEWAGEEIADPDAISATVQIGDLLQVIRQSLNGQKKASDEIPQVLSPQHGAQVPNFVTSGTKTAPKTDQKPDSQAAPGDTVLSVVEGDNGPPRCGPDVESQELSRAEIADLSPQSQAAETLAAFQSAGFDHVQLRLQDADGNTVHSRIVSILDGFNILPKALSQADRRQASLMVRPMNGDHPQIRMTPAEIAIDDAEVRARAIQLDDINLVRFEKVLPLAAFGFTTSPGNYQAVVFVRADKETARGLRRRFVKGVGSDPGATGSYRVPGSGNWKPGRNGVRVQLLHLVYGRVLTPEQIEATGLLAPCDPPPAPRPTLTRYEGPKKFPDYSLCLSRAGLKTDGKTPNYSAADMSFANIARDRGFSAGEIAVELTALRSGIDDKAKRNPAYIERTVAAAFR